MLFTVLLILTAVWILCFGLAGWRRVARDAAFATESSLFDATDEELTVQDPDMAEGEDPAAGGKRSSRRWPKVSVVSYALRDEEALSEYLDILLAQDYPDMEVVLVCDASAEATSMIAERFGNVGNLHITFIPPGSHNLSRRKLAQTVGIKAAKGDVVILTSTSVAPESDRWVREMARPFAADPKTAAALGFMHLPIADLSGKTKWYRQFDYIIESANWIYSAIKGDPYRCSGGNLALRRSCFFSNKGYATTISLMDGDDDIFIREIARHGRVEMQLSADSAVNACRGEQTDAFYIDLKDRHIFTRQYLPRSPFVRMAALSASQWILLLTALLSLLSAAIGFPGLIDPDRQPGVCCVSSSELIIPPTPGAAIATAAITLITLATVWGSVTAAYRRLAAPLGAVRLFWATVPFMLWRPLGNIIFNINHRPMRKSHYTWQR